MSDVTNGARAQAREIGAQRLDEIRGGGPALRADGAVRPTRPAPAPGRFLGGIVFEDGVG